MWHDQARARPVSSVLPPNKFHLPTPLQPPDAIYDAVTETSDGKDHIPEVGWVGLYSTYDVIITDENISIDHRDEYHKEGEPGR